MPHKHLSKHALLKQLDNDKINTTAKHTQKPKIAISVGDTNGVGLEIILKSHSYIASICEPIYCAHKNLFEKALLYLQDFTQKHSQHHQNHHLHNSHLDSVWIEKMRENIKSMRFYPPQNARSPKIAPSSINKASGRYSFASFMCGLDLVDSGRASAIVTLPIHKAAWKKARIHHTGHTQVLRTRYKKDAIMMLGCEEMFVALFSEHIPLKSVSSTISTDKYVQFLIALYRSFTFDEALVLGFNPHCGDDGAIGGKEDNKIESARKKVNKFLKKNVFSGIVPPDSAFTPLNREKFKLFVAPYHDIGLSTLKALYFEKSINVSLNLPIIRTSVDHGVAYDIAYKSLASTQSYQNAVLFAIKMLQERHKIEKNILNTSMRAQTPRH